MPELVAWIRPRPWRSATTLACAVLLPAVVRDPYLLHITCVFLLYAVMAMGLSVVVSRAGLLDLGYVAFLAVGAYSYAILNRSIGLPFLVALPLGGALAALAGLLLGFPTLRVRGDYLALVTLAFGEMVRQLLQNWSAVTGGPRGIPAISAPDIGFARLGLPWQYYFLVLALTVLAVLTLRRIHDSPVARIWEAIRDDETAARTCGIDSTSWLLLAFAIGATFAGISGVTFAAIQRFVSPESFVLDESILILSIVVLAGGRSIPRIFFAAAVLYGLPEALRGVREYRSLLFGLLLVLFTILDYRLRGSRRRGAAAGSLVQESPVPSVGRFPPALRSPRGGAASYSVQGLSKTFRGLRALDGVTFSSPDRGRILALVGPNGAGKTTLFDCFSALLQPERGEIRLDGSGPVTGRRAFEVAREGVGRTYQKVRLFESMTVRENIEVGALCGARVPVLRSLVLGMGLKQFRRDAQERVAAALAYTGLAELGDRPVTSLPTGVRRLVEIARALASRPRILLLDEVASGLNEAEKARLADLLRRVAEDGGLPLLLVEHDISFVQALAGDVVVLDEGKVIARGTPAAVFADPKVIDSYVGAPPGGLSFAIGS